jgi:hypothetical protein
MRGIMGLIALGNKENKSVRGRAPVIPILIIPILSPAPPKSPFTPFLTRGQGDLLVVVANGSVNGTHWFFFSYVVPKTMHSIKNSSHSLSFRLVRNPSAVVSRMAPLEKSQWSEEGRG